MYILQNFILDLEHYLIGTRKGGHNIIRKHTKKIELLGDISFPLNIKNWHNLLDINLCNDKMVNIFDYRSLGSNLISQTNDLKAKSEEWCMVIDKIVVEECEVHIFLARFGTYFPAVLGEVLKSSHKYGFSICLSSKINIKTNLKYDKLEDVDLTALRLLVLAEVSRKLLELTCSNEKENELEVYISTNLGRGSQRHVLCGPVLNENGIKSSSTAGELYRQRMLDMRMMAQHKYGVQVKPNTSWESYFDKLGRACVIIEILSNKPQKSIKITHHDLQTVNKGPSFIFYNCARLSALFREFDKRVLADLYPKLPNIEEVDFTLLNQPEEWELFYVYVVQFPIIVNSCIKDIENGILNPQYLISFLSNLSSIFSTYYRRVRILTDPREHLQGVLHARIYLLKAIQIIFHNTLEVLGIEPIKEM